MGLKDEGRTIVAENQHEEHKKELAPPKMRVANEIGIGSFVIGCLLIIKINWIGSTIGDEIQDFILTSIFIFCAFVGSISAVRKNKEYYQMFLAKAGLVLNSILLLKVAIALVFLFTSSANLTTPTEDYHKLEGIDTEQDVGTGGKFD